MKLCATCNRIVDPASPDCARQDCPFAGLARGPAGEEPAPAPALAPGASGRADAAVQSGLDAASRASRQITRTGLIAAAFAGLAGVAAVIIFVVLQANKGKGEDNIWDYRNIPESSQSAGLELPGGRRLIGDYSQPVELTPGNETELSFSPGPGETAMEIIVARAPGEAGACEGLRVGLVRYAWASDGQAFSPMDIRPIQARRIVYNDRTQGLRFVYRTTPGVDDDPVLARLSATGACKVKSIGMALDAKAVADPHAVAAERISLTRHAQKPPESLAVRLARADAQRGEKVVMKCLSCHTVEAGGMNGIGPNLFGVVGRKKADVRDFAYSEALSAKTGPWSLDDLDQWLTSPAAYAPGTKMSFAGLSDPEERADLLAYLQTLM